MSGETTQGVAWGIDEYGDIELYHMNEQCPAYINREDIKEFILQMDSWKIEKDIRDAQDKARQENQDYQDYLRLKERFEK